MSGATAGAVLRRAIEPASFGYPGRHLLSLSKSADKLAATPTALLHPIRAATVSKEVLKLRFSLPHYLYSFLFSPLPYLFSPFSHIYSIFFFSPSSSLPFIFFFSFYLYLFFFFYNIFSSYLPKYYPFLFNLLFF